MIPDEAVEAAVHATGRAHNPKWDHPIMGYETFSDDQKQHLREVAREALKAAAPHLVAEAKAEAWDEGWRGGYDTHSAKFSLNPYRRKP